MSEEINNKKSNVLLIVLVILLVLCLIGLTCYKVFIYDKKDNNKNSGNKNGTSDIPLNIYYDDTENYYNDKSSSKNTKIGTINCLHTCKFLKAAKDYVLVFEDKAYSIYDYKNNKLVSSKVFNEVNIDSEQVLNNFYFITGLDDSTLAAAYISDGYTYIYDLSSNKTSKIDGLEGYRIAIGSADYDKYKLLHNYNFVQTNGIYNFKTGDKLFDKTVDWEEINNNLYFYDNSKIYDTDGKEILNVNNIKEVKWIDDKTIIVGTKSFYTYDKNFKREFSSTAYDQIITLKEKYILVFNNKKLQLIDLDGKLLTTFDAYNDAAEFSYENFTYNIENVKDSEISFSIQTKKATFDEIKKDNPTLNDDEIKQYLNDGRVGYQYVYNKNSNQVRKYAITFFGHD